MRLTALAWAPSYRGGAERRGTGGLQRKSRVLAQGHATCCRHDAARPGGAHGRPITRGSFQSGVRPAARLTILGAVLHARPLDVVSKGLRPLLNGGPGDTRVSPQPGPRVRLAGMGPHSTRSQRGPGRTPCWQYARRTRPGCRRGTGRFSIGSSWCPRRGARGTRRPRTTSWGRSSLGPRKRCSAVLEPRGGALSILQLGRHGDALHVAHILQRGAERRLIGHLAERHRAP